MREIIRRAEARAGHTFELEVVPIDAIRARHAGNDPLQTSFAALMLALAAGDPVREAEASARKMGVSLTPFTVHLEALLQATAAGPPA
jgi:hypothetical protein